jgi:hypothetical protein
VVLVEGVPVISVPVTVAVVAGAVPTVAVPVEVVPLVVPVASLDNCTVTVSQLAPVTGTPAVPVVLTAGVSVVSAEGVISTEGVSVPREGSVATGGRVLTGALVGVAALEQALSARTNISTTPKIFGYFISLLSKLLVSKDVPRG